MADQPAAQVTVMRLTHARQIAGGADRYRRHSVGSFVRKQAQDLAAVKTGASKLPDFRSRRGLLNLLVFMSDDAALPRKDSTKLMRDKILM